MENRDRNIPLQCTYMECCAENSSLSTTLPFYSARRVIEDDGLVRLSAAVQDGNVSSTSQLNTTLSLASPKILAIYKLIDWLISSVTWCMLEKGLWIQLRLNNHLDYGSVAIANNVSVISTAYNTTDHVITAGFIVKISRLFFLHCQNMELVLLLLIYNRSLFITFPTQPPHFYYDKIPINQSINKSNFYSANIPGEARLSGATAKSVFNSKIEDTVL